MSNDPAASPHPTTVEDIDTEWLTEVLRASGAIDVSTTVTDAQMAPFRVGAGLLGQLTQLSLTYARGNGPATVIAKSPIEVPHQRGMADAMNVYEREVRFYNELRPRSTLRTVGLHAANIDTDAGTSLILMDDLSALRQGDRVHGLSWDDAVTAISALAAFHAGWHDSPELAGLSETWFALDAPLYNVILPQFVEAGWSSCQAHAAEHLDDDLVAFGDDWAELLPAMQRQLAASRTLIHSDWRSDNMFFDDDGEVVLVDFQLVGVGTGAYDVAYFLCQSLEREVRAGRERELVELYAAELARHGVDRDVDDIWFDFQVAVGFCFIYGIVSYAQYELLPGEGQQVIDTILRRSATGIVDTGAIAAVRSLVS